MKEYKVLVGSLNNPLPITKEICSRCSEGLNRNLGTYQKYVLPRTNYISDVQIFRLDYLNSALNLIKECVGFEEHIKQYKNDFESTFFVTLAADIFLGHGFEIELEPDIPGHEKKPDLVVSRNGLDIYIECKSPKKSTEYLIKEQRKMFYEIKDILSSDLSYALFYKKELSNQDIITLQRLIEANQKKKNDICENDCIVDDKDLGVKIIVSGIYRNIEKKYNIEMLNIPNFSEIKGYSNANGINCNGKNILFYKKTSENSFKDQLNKSRRKVPKDSPYIVCIDFSGTRFDMDYYSKFLQEKHFHQGNDTSISGVLLIEHGLSYEGKYSVRLNYVENSNAKYKLPFSGGFFHETLEVDIESRYKS